MLYRSLFVSRFSRIVLCGLLPVLLSGCSYVCMKERAKLAELQQQQVVMLEEYDAMAADLAEKKNVAARLQMELVEKQAEKTRVRATQKIAPPKKMQSNIHISVPTTKVEAVTCHAEVVTEINTAKEVLKEGGGQVFVQIDQLMEESRGELEKGSYDTACSLAARAMELIRSLRVPVPENKVVISSTPTDFIMPLQFKLVMRSNIRKKPTTRDEVLTVLDQGTVVTATGYQDKWIRVNLSDGRQGWIYSSLLKVLKAL